jgi:integrase
VSSNHKWNDFPFSRINRSFIDGFIDYLKNEAACGHNTSMKHLAIFKKVYKIALDNQWIRYNAFSGLKMPIKIVDRAFLTEEEIKRIIDKRIDIQRLDLVKDLFIFACFTGLAYIDMKNLKRKSLQDNLSVTWIKIKREKTGVEATIPLLPPARRILDKWAPNWKTWHPEKELFPTPSNQKTNEYLKEVTDLCGITKPVSFHCARHSFATTIALSNNIPIETVSKMLGHSRISMTQHYSKVVDLKIARDTGLLLEKYK